MQKYDVGAYIWPSYSGDDLRSRIFWPEGYGEWQTVKAAQAKFEGHKWPRKPLWGYVNEGDPYVMEMQIEAAVRHGVNVFIYDWYWYDNRPFLENCLNDGFLKAANNKKMKFFLMYANHSVGSIWDKRTAGTPYLLWDGKVNLDQFRTICQRWLDNYFCLDNYYKIDGKPVVSIYQITTFIKGFGGIEGTKKALNMLQEMAKERGHKGVHVQLITSKWLEKLVKDDLTGTGDGGSDITVEQVKTLGFDSITNYQYLDMVADFNKDYETLIPELQGIWKDYAESYKGAMYCPHVSVGWDNNPRYNTFRPIISQNNTPENFEKHLRAVKKFTAEHRNAYPLITINSWNEWTETSYLEPDDLNGYGMLEAVKKVFVDEE